MYCSVCQETVKQKHFDNEMQACDFCLDSNKRYRKNNKHKISMYNKQYNENNKSKIQERVECIYCGYSVRKYNIDRHQQTQKHQQNKRDQQIVEAYVKILNMKQKD